MPWLMGNRPFLNSWNPSPGYFGFWPWLPTIAIWSLIWGGLALWHAAKRNEKWWFIIFLFVHTAGILEIIYLVFVVKLFNTTQTIKPKRARKK